MLCQLSILKIELLKYLAFVEDIWDPIKQPTLPTPLSTTTTERPTPPPNDLTDECLYFCQKVSSCKDILRTYRQYTCLNEFNWSCFGQEYWQCPWRLGCPVDHIRSGFGNTAELQRRCLPLHQCKYLAHMYQHLNDLHEGVMQLCWEEDVGKSFHFRLSIPDGHCRWPSH